MTFTRPFQEAMTAWCWGFGWGDETIDPKTRSMMNLAMIGALGKMHEWETHCRGALTNGVSKEEIRAIIHVVGIYCGVPQALECFRVANKVLGKVCRCLHPLCVEAVCLGQRHEIRVLQFGSGNALGVRPLLVHANGAISAIVENEDHRLAARLHG
jgi:4-carboxymuconolactone decarboxylase